VADSTNQGQFLFSTFPINHSTAPQQAHNVEQVPNTKLTYNHKCIQTWLLLDKREPNQNCEHSLTRN